MKISVLIPTHNRPELFKRCLNSVLVAKNLSDVDVEIVVNNDSCDITEMYSDVVRYYYKKSPNLSDIYRGLFERSTNEYVYFLEDDDIMNPNFFRILNKYDEDILYFNYRPYRWSAEFIRYMGYTKKLHDNLDDFLERYDDYYFQIGQMCFRKTCLDINDFPDDNCLQNDFKIFQRLKGSFRSIDDVLYTQTISGGDNISFKKLNKDVRWIS